MFAADGVLELNGVTLLELEDVAKQYRHPSIIDIKLGFRTWYPSADQRYIDKCKAKDASTTQAALGFKICGMQVCSGHLEVMCIEHSARVYWDVLTACTRLLGSLCALAPACLNECALSQQKAHRAEVATHRQQLCMHIDQCPCSVLFQL